MKSANQGRDLLAEIQPDGKVAWKITRAQLVGQIEGFVGPRTGIEEMRITKLHAYDSARMKSVLTEMR